MAPRDVSLSDSPAHSIGTAESQVNLRAVEGRWRKSNEAEADWPSRLDGLSRCGISGNERWNFARAFIISMRGAALRSDVARRAYIKIFISIFLVRQYAWQLCWKYLIALQCLFAAT